MKVHIKKWFNHRRHFYLPKIVQMLLFTLKFFIELRCTMNDERKNEPKEFEKLQTPEKSKDYRYQAFNFIHVSRFVTN